MVLLFSKVEYHVTLLFKSEINSSIVLQSGISCLFCTKWNTIKILFVKKKKYDNLRTVYCSTNLNKNEQNFHSD